MKDKIKDLINAINTKETDNPQEMFEFVWERLEKFTNYFNAVYKDVVKSTINRELLVAGRISQEEFQDRITNSDFERRTCHNSAISACAQLNRLCDAYEIEKFCPETDDRHIIADFIGTFVYNIYQEGIGEATLDKAVENAHDEPLNPDYGYEPISDEWEER